MDRSPDHALTPADAKRRLRLAARRCTVAGWVRAHPFDAAITAALLGFLAAHSPPSRRLAGRLATRLLREL